MISQISVFLENQVGRLNAFSGALADGGINIKAICIADTVDFGILRCIVDHPEKAVEVLHQAGFTASITKVLGVSVGDVPGGLHTVLQLLADNEIGVDYVYSLVRSASGQADLVFKVEDPENTAAILEKAGVKVIMTKDL